MRKLLIPLIITLLLTISNNTFAQFSGGSGTSADPWKISNIDTLRALSTRVNSGITYNGKYFKLTVNLSGVIAFTPIGNSATNSFQGNFDGDGHTISDITIISGNYIGLFGYIANATIKKIGIVSENITSVANSCTGGLVGYASNSTISECFSKVNLSVSSNNNSISGGLIGKVYNSIINNCFFTIGKINGSGTYIGGLIGYIENNSIISNCFSSPNNFPNINNSGPLYGYCSSDSPIYNSYYYDNWRSQAYGIPINQQYDMATLDFAKNLNACQNQTWRKIPNNGSSTYYPTLYWQVPPYWLNGTEIMGCGLDGGGLPNNPFKIRNVKDLVTLSNNVNNGTTTYFGQYLLVENDINFYRSGQTDSSQYFSPIGKVEVSGGWPYTTTYYPFSGNFNGGSHVISNLEKITGTYVGLFGYISEATISNLGIEGFAISTTSSSSRCGALIGYTESAQITNCYVSNSTITGKGGDCRVGGLIGNANNSSTINNCYARATIKSNGNNGTRYYGGLVGYLGASTISNSYSAPQSIDFEDYGGSLVGGINGTVNTDTAYYLSISGTNVNRGISKSPNELQSGCFVVNLNNSQSPIVWFKAKSGVNSGYPVLSWQKLSDGITPAGFEGNCLSVSVNDGHQANPYKVKYVKDLIYISNMVANDTTYNENGVKKYFQMQNDISFIKYDNINTVLVDSSSLYVPIGSYTTSSNNKPFSGNFDAYYNSNRYAIANYSFLDATKDNIGIFGYLKGATIQNLGISNINIRAKDNIGGLVGNMDANSTLNSCFVYGYINGVSNVGGLVGNTTTASCSILQSFSNTTIDAQTNVGGIVGKHGGGAISNSYSNSEIYSSTYGNNYVGGIIGLANSASNLTNVYSTCKIIRNGTNTNFGKIKGNNIGSNTNCYSRDSVFVNYTNIDPTGYTVKNNADLRSATFVTNLNNASWNADYSDNINDGYPILNYQPQAVKPNSSGFWPTTTASQVVIIKNGVQLKANSTNYPKCAYIIIEKGGELYNNTDINLFGEQRRELVLGKWNFIGITTNNPTMSFLYNYADTAYKTFVKQFDPSINNWATTTIQNNNTQLNYNTGFLVMPNYSLDALQLTTSRIASKGVLYNTNTSTKTFTNNATSGLVPLANNYNANMDVTKDVAKFLIDNSNIPDKLVYVFDADNRFFITNYQSINPVSAIKPGEGFFVKAATVSGSISFSRAQLISSAKKIAFKELIYVKAKTNDIIREAFIEFNEDAENGFDVEDGLMLFGTNEDIVEPYFKKEDNEILKDAFSSLPYSTELNLRSYSSNNINLEFSNLPKDIKVYLIDSFLRKVQELNSNPLYNLGITEGNNENRLKILFTNNERDIVNYFNTDEVDKIQIWNSNSIININGIGLNSFEVYDIMGQKILQQVITSDGYQTNLNLKSGIYIIKAYSQTSKSSRKISICR